MKMNVSFEIQNKMSIIGNIERYRLPKGLKQTITAIFPATGVLIVMISTAWNA